MFSVIFSGQGSQIVGMGKEFYEKYELVKKLFKEADDVLDLPLSKIILEDSKRRVRPNIKYATSNFLISYSIFQCYAKRI